MAYNLYKNIKYDIQCPNTINGKELKILYNKMAGNDENKNVRILFGGAEIKDENMLYQLKIDNGYLIQVLDN